MVAMMEKDYNYHNMIKNTIFGENVTDQDVTSILSKIGWVYTFLFVLNSALGKFLGAKAVAPYGKFADSYSYLTGINSNVNYSIHIANFPFKVPKIYLIELLFFPALRLNAKLAWIIQEMPAFVISILLLWEAKSSINLTQFLILGMFLIHYFNR